MTEIAGPDRRDERPRQRQQDSVDFLEQRLREQVEDKRVAQAQADARLADALVANQELKNRLGERALKDAAAAATPHKAAPHWVGIVTAVLVAAVGGGAGGAGITHVLTPTQRDDKTTLLLQQANDASYTSLTEALAIKYHLRRKQEQEDRRWSQTITMLCRLNHGEAWTRGIDCKDGIDWESVPLNKGEWAHKAKADFPRTERAP